jgi:uncharacterized membrane protein YhhN
MTPLVAVTLTAVATCALLWSEWRRSRAGVWIAKPIASLGFIALGVTLAGAHPDPYAGSLLAALVACAIGDVLLIPAQPRAFQLGVASFALGHLLYGWAFWGRGVHVITLLVSAAFVTVVARRVWRWLTPHVPQSLKPALVAYVCIITAMLAVAASAAVATHDLRIGAGALMFWLSDLSVARDKFVAPGFVNRAWGLPLYYAAQLVLASSLLPVS